IDHVTIDRRRDIQPAARKLIFPDDLARPWLQGIYPAVARAADEQLLAANSGDDGAGIDRVRRSQPGAGNPGHLARFLIESDETMRRRGQVTPAHEHRAEDDEIFVDDRVIGAAAVRRNETHLLVQRDRPKHLTRFAVVTLEQAAGPEGIDVA